MIMPLHISKAHSITIKMQILASCAHQKLRALQQNMLFVVDRL
nr:MAG TPA: hypothetical protein [Caudoviricetes sp.]